MEKKKKRIFSSFLTTAALLLVAMSVTGCGPNGPRVRRAVGQGAATVGAVVVQIPHPVARVAGAIIVAVGVILSVEAEVNGELDRVQIQLSDDQLRQLREGAKLIVEDPQGKKKVVPIK